MHLCHIAGASDNTAANCRMWLLDLFCAYYDALTMLDCSCSAVRVSVYQDTLFGHHKEIMMFNISVCTYDVQKCVFWQFVCQFEQ